MVDSALLPRDLESVVRQSTNFERVLRTFGLTVQRAELNSETEIWRITRARGTVTNSRDTAPLIEHRLQRHGHRVRKERERVHEVALAGAISSNEKSRVAELDALAWNASKALQNQTLHKRWDHGDGGVIEGHLIDPDLHASTPRSDLRMVTAARLRSPQCRFMHFAGEVPRAARQRAAAACAAHRAASCMLVHRQANGGSPDAGHGRPARVNPAPGLC